MSKLPTALLCLCAFPMRAQQTTTPAELVEQLAVAEQRTSARRQLLALGKEAVPALADRVATADQDLLPELLAVLVELGPKAGAAVPQLFATACNRKVSHLESVLWTLGELVPYRAAESEFDDRSRASIAAALRHRPVGGEETSTWVASQRIGDRLRLPRTPDVDTLVTMVQGYDAFRVELAIEHLGQCGRAANAALPYLRRLLERPEPRILMTNRTVPIHSKAARAVLAIAPTSEDAELARAVLEGKAPALPAAAPIPERAQTRVAELLAELEVPATRAAAAGNLTALGRLAAPGVAAALLQRQDPGFREAALGILRDIGRDAAPIVPQLLDALLTLSTDHTLSVMRALQATAPWCTDVVPGVHYEGSVRSLRIFGRPIAGNMSAELLNAFYAAGAQLAAAMTVDPSCSPTELETLLEQSSVAIRECALAVLRERGAEARSLLPKLAAMLTADQPKLSLAVMLAAGNRSTSHKVDRSEHVHRLAAQAIVAIAAADDPLVAEAQAILARPEPK